MITAHDLHVKGFIELTESNGILFFSGKGGILLFQNGKGYIPYYWNGSCYDPGVMFTELSELESLLKNRSLVSNKNGH